MSRLTRDGTAEPVSRDQILRYARGQGNIHFRCSADHKQDWQPYPVDPYSAICDDHTVIVPSTWVRRGPCPARRLKAFKASHVWAAGGARAEARRSTGDVLGGLPPEKSRGLRGGPAQRQRAEVGRSRSCCQGWTGLDDCCEERGQVARGGREGSGGTR